jgi:hypothetical protein
MRYAAPGYMGPLLWLIPTVLLAVLLCLMLWNRAYKEWSWFSSYVAFGVVADVARFALHKHPRPLYWTYWLTDAGYALLGTLALYEVFGAVLRYPTSVWWARHAFPAILVTGIGLSLARANIVPPHVSGLLYYVVVGEIAVRFVQVLAFVALVAFVTFFGFRWRRHSLGIAAGFGLYSTVALPITIRLSDVGTRFTFLWGVISLMAYSLAVLIWIVCFLVRPEERCPLDRVFVSQRTGRPSAPGQAMNACPGADISFTPAP